MENNFIIDIPNPGCAVCKDPLDFDFTFAFQPIVEVNQRSIFAYEALVRGPNNEDASEVLAKVTDENRYKFDQECRIRSILLAMRLKMTSYISINFLPKAVYQPELCIRTTIAAAKAANFPLNKIIFEVTEGEHVESEKLLAIFKYYKEVGFATAIDDFGAGYAGLGLLSDFQPTFIKIDIKLVRNIDSNPVKQAIVKGILLTMKMLNIKVIAEGVETAAEVEWFQQHDVALMQGFYFADPGFESLPVVTDW